MSRPRRSAAGPEGASASSYSRFPRPRRLERAFSSKVLLAPRRTARSVWAVYELHPSLQLQKLFREKPYQGAKPEDAEFIFIGLDANYARDIERTPAFQRIREYHEDGVTFWKRYEKHHPFLLFGYRGDGHLYHRNFAEIGFLPEDASRVAFIELLHVPTCGRSNLEVQDLDGGHLARLNALVQEDQLRHVFVPSAVANLMRDTETFGWLREAKPVSGQVLPVLHEAGETRMYQNLHFSCYGRFQKRMTEQAAAIRALARIRDAHAAE